MSKQNLVTQVIALDKDRKDQLSQIFKDQGLTFASGARYVLYQYLEQQKQEMIKNLQFSYDDLKHLQNGSLDSHTESSKVNVSDKDKENDQNQSLDKNIKILTDSLNMSTNHNTVSKLYNDNGEYIGTFENYHHMPDGSVVYDVDHQPVGTYRDGKLEKFENFNK